MFPTERMVYLSPDSKNDLKCYDPNDIYIIGGIVDRGSDRLVEIKTNLPVIGIAGGI